MPGNEPFLFGSSLHERSPPSYYCPSPTKPPATQAMSDVSLDFKRVRNKGELLLLFYLTCSVSLPFSSVGFPSVIRIIRGQSFLPFTLTTPPKKVKEKSILICKDFNQVGVHVSVLGLGLGLFKLVVSTS